MQLRKTCFRFPPYVRKRAPNYMLTAGHKVREQILSDKGKGGQRDYFLFVFLKGGEGGHRECKGEKRDKKLDCYR